MKARKEKEGKEGRKGGRKEGRKGGRKEESNRLVKSQLQDWTSVPGMWGPLIHCYDLGNRRESIS